MPKVHVDANHVCFYCVACKHAHCVPISDPGPHVWQFNGDVERPTITPSLRIFVAAVDEPDFKLPEHTCCHVVVTDGMLNYCGDCPHELRGQSVPMVEWERP